MSKSDKAESPASGGETYVEPGILYLVSTPIGNLHDITLRALRVLKEAHLVAAGRQHVIVKSTE